ncbi:hypothetical protein DB347_23480 [Opitutaceae bacterium EW11]|nr:hypothetical protein DB347_23480 [Opitutaceae bacterium EW11]
MNKLARGFLGCLASLSLSVALAADDPKPQQVLQVANEELPVYASGQINPLHTERPQYPRTQRDKSVQGQVVLMVVIGADGKVAQSEVKESTPTKEFGQAAQECVRHWKYPKLKWRGVPSRYVVVVPFVFELR